VRVKRKRPDRWVTVAKGKTGTKGGYTIAIPRKNGRYRVVAPKITRGGGDDICLNARSSSFRIRHA
jgi:hypothetical protein